jgi:hypothetical protein
MSRTIALVACGFLAVGCFATSGTEVLLQRSASDLGCPSVEEVSTGFVGVKEVRGCGKTNVYVRSGGEQQWLSPLDRAPFELGCDKASLTTSPLDPKTVGVSGCGKRAVYIAVFPGAYGKWVLDSVSTEGGLPAPPPAENASAK